MIQNFQDLHELDVIATLIRLMQLGKPFTMRLIPSTKAGKPPLSVRFWNVAVVTEKSEK